MPNHVTHKMTFAEDKAVEVFAACCPDGRFDFRTLVPQPPHIYQGNLSGEDEKDFPCNWLSWSRENWGTKWNAYDTTCGVENGKAFIKFDTAWSVPYPVLSAFANKFGIPFEHRYFDEDHNFWGVEEWKGEDGRVSRAKVRKSHEDDKTPLCVELKGYDPTRDEEDDEAA